MLQFWKDHGTKILGGTIAVLSGLAAGTVILPPPLSNYSMTITAWAAFVNTILGMVVIGRGVQNTSAIAASVVAQTPPASSSGSSTLKSVLLALVVCAGALTVHGCATVKTALGITKPLTFNDQLATGYGAATAVLTTTDALLTAGKITPKVALSIEAQDQNLKAALDIAAQVAATNATDGGNQLQAALTAITALTSYLTTLQPTATK